MTIHWSSDAAQQVSQRLKRVRNVLEDNIRQAVALRRKLDETNADGDDQVLTELSQRLKVCTDALMVLSQQMENFCRAVNRSDEEFQDTEHGISTAIGILKNNAMHRLSGNNAYADQVNWEPSAYAVMPQMRTGTNRVPGWLDQIMTDI